LALLNEAKDLGLSLTVENGMIIWESSRPPPNHLLTKLASHRDEIVAALSDFTEDEPLSSEDRGMLEAWLNHVGETDITIRQRAVERCSADRLKLEHVLKQARRAGLSATPFPKPQERLPALPTAFSPLQSLENLPLLPEDKTFLLRLLQGKSNAMWQRLMEGYRQVWHEASDREPVPHRRDSAGRRAANTWIRHEI